MFAEVLLSFVVETSLMDNDGVASSSVMVNVAVESLILPSDALLIVIVAVSLSSSNASSVIETVNVLEVSPALNVKVENIGQHCIVILK